MRCVRTCPAVDMGRRTEEPDSQMASAALEILGTGFPLDELLRLAVSHANHVAEVTDTAIDLFDAHVRSGGPTEGDDPAITAAFKTLLPHVTRLVALHFQRTVINRALERLRNRGNPEVLEQALEATRSAQLEVSWRS